MNVICRRLQIIFSAIFMMLCFGEMTLAEETEYVIATINTTEEGKTYDTNLGVYTYCIDSSPADLDIVTSSNDSAPGDVSVKTSNSSSKGADRGEVTDCPVSEKVPISEELQKYLWEKCKAATTDYENYYAFCLGVMEHESTFRAKATHKNSNGTVDRGIMQINSSNVKKMIKKGLIASSDDLFNPYKCIDCGMSMLNEYIGMFGVSESAYYAYNTGKERKGSNKNSRIVIKYMAKWDKTLFEEAA